MSESSNNSAPKRFDYEAERLKILSAQKPEEGEGTHWDQKSPTRTPGAEELKVPKHLEKIVKFFQGIIADEGLLLELCLVQCLEMIQRNAEARMVGIDRWAGGEGGGQFSVVQYMVIAGPMTVELYKQVILGINGRQKEYEQLVQESLMERERASAGASRIIVPP